MRADALRNRGRILEAARTLFERDGVANVRVEDVASEAKVGKATVFRHFGDRSSLVLALLDEQERQLQEEILRGEPPLGPGAPPRKRLIALVDALVGLLERYRELLYESETGKPGARYATGAYQAWHRHATALIGEASPDVDAPVMAHCLLAPLAAELFTHIRRTEAIGVERLRSTLHELARRATETP